MQPFSEQFMTAALMCGAIALPITQSIKKIFPKLAGWSAWMVSAVVCLAVVFVQSMQSGMALASIVLLWIVVVLESNGIYLFGSKVIGNGKPKVE